MRVLEPEVVDAIWQAIEALLRPRSRPTHWVSSTRGRTGCAPGILIRHAAWGGQKAYPEPSLESDRNPRIAARTEWASHSRVRFLGVADTFHLGVAEPRPPSRVGATPMTSNGERGECRAVRGDEAVGPLG